MLTVEIPVVLCAWVCPDSMIFAASRGKVAKVPFQSALGCESASHCFAPLAGEFLKIVTIYGRSFSQEGRRDGEKLVVDKVRMSGFLIRGCG